MAFSGQVRVVARDREGRLGAELGVSAVAGSTTGHLLVGALDQLPRVRDAEEASQVSGSTIVAISGA